MARVHVSLPEDLYDQLKSHGWSASEVLREAIQERLHRERRLREADEWYEELLATLGPPSPEDEDLAERMIRATEKARERSR